MKLSKKDTALYYELMWSLHLYVNRKLNIHPDIKKLEAYRKYDTEKKLKVREAIFADTQLIDAFVKNNPENFSHEHLEIVSGWKNFTKGEFYIERFLKKYAILISNDKVFGVSGVENSFDELIHRSYLPLNIQTILLPFKGRIIYDGIFQSYNIYFGGGIKRRLKETYMRAKQNNRIIDSFDPVKKESRGKKVSHQPRTGWPNFRLWLICRKS